MKHLPIAEWLLSLDRIEAALAQIVQGTDRYEAAFGALFVEPAPAHANAGTGDKLSAIASRFAERDRRMSAVAELADSVERLIGEREAAVIRWREACSEWSRRIEQGATRSPGDFVGKS